MVDALVGFLSILLRIETRMFSMEMLTKISKNKDVLMIYVINGEVSIGSFLLCISLPKEYY